MPSRKGNRMDTFHMTDIIPILPLPYPPNGRSSYYVPCPHCDSQGKRHDKHLNINIYKDVFRCPKCGWHGGVFDLYAYYTNTPREGIREELKRVIKGEDSGRKTPSQVSIPMPPEPAETPAADIEIRHAAYSTLLSLLTLAQDHQANLFNRGLSERVIYENEYRSTPVVGEKALAKHIINVGCALEGVPGFYPDKDGQWSFVPTSRGILIPVRDSSHRIQGMQIRRDNEIKRKYRWVSSAGMNGGCGAEGWVHIAGPVREKITLTEGPLKADIVYHLTGQTVVAVPGVNSLKHLEKTLSELMELGVRQVMTAFDMDFLKNPHVQNGYSELVNLLNRLNLHFGTYLWHPEYNGLDDYIWGYCLNGGSR